MHNRGNKTCQNCDRHVSYSRDTCANCGSSVFREARPACILCSKRGLLGSVSYRSTKDKEWRCSQCGTEFSQEELDQEEERLARKEERRAREEATRENRNLAAARKRRKAEIAAQKQAAIEEWQCFARFYVPYGLALIVIVLSVSNHFAQIIPISTVEWIIAGIVGLAILGITYFIIDRHKCYLGIPISAGNWAHIFLKGISWGIVASSILYFIWPVLKFIWAVLKILWGVVVWFWNL